MGILNIIIIRPFLINCYYNFSGWVYRKDEENYRGLTALACSVVAVCMLAAPPTPVSAGSRYTVIYKDTVLNCARKQIKIRDAISAGNMLYNYSQFWSALQ